jgi:hypothetical protein
MTARDRKVLLLLAGALLAAFHGAWWPGRTFFARDLTYLFHPMDVWTAENLQAGRLPLWNPFVSGGVPWLGQPQTGVFYPGNLLFWIFPFAPGLALFSALHFFLSALGGVLWARAAGGSSRAALAAGLLWSLNGFWRARVEFPPLLAVLAWTPWLGLFFRRKGALLPALAGALALTAGHWPQLFWSGLLAFAVSGGLDRARAAAAPASAALAAALGAAALLPGAELLFRSDRAAGLAESVAGLHAFSPRQWAGLVWPWASAFRDQAYTGEKFFWTGCFFTGVVGALLAAAAFVRAPGRMKWVWAGLFAAGAALTLGPATPLFSILRFLRVRYPGQQSFWMTGAVLAAVTAGAPLWEKTLGRLAGRRAVAAAAVLVAAELLILGAGMAPVIGADYFHRKAPWIASIQEAESGTEPRRVFMTPRAISDMSAAGKTWEDTWVLLREKGLSLTTLPYHVRNLNPHGFSLNPASTEKVLEDLYGRASYADAREPLDRLSVRWVASPAPMTAPGLAPRAGGPWFLYERTDAAPAPYAEMDDPGWTASGGRRLFRPLPFRVGLMIALLGWTALAAWAFRRLPCL